VVLSVLAIHADEFAGVADEFEDVIHDLSLIGCPSAFLSADPKLRDGEGAELLAVAYPKQLLCGFDVFNRYAFTDDAHAAQFLHESRPCITQRLLLFVDFPAQIAPAGGCVLAPINIESLHINAPSVSDLRPLAANSSNRYLTSI
jgi:hypothetical protein